MLEHLKARKCDVDLYPGFSCENDVAIFPLFNFGFKRTGSIYYRPDGAKRVQNDEKGRYYTYISPGEVGIFGLESLNFSDTIFLVSGIFKSTALHRLGFTALHVSSVSYRNLKPQLLVMGRPYKAIGDNDAEGAQFVRRYGGFQSPMDIDEMTDSDILEMIND
jgi:hypothetical protein